MHGAHAPVCGQLYTQDRLLRMRTTNNDNQALQRTIVQDRAAMQTLCPQSHQNFTKASSQDPCRQHDNISRGSRRRLSPAAPLTSLCGGGSVGTTVQLQVQVLAALLTDQCAGSLHRKEDGCVDRDGTPPGHRQTGEVSH